MALVDRSSVESHVSVNEMIVLKRLLELWNEFDTKIDTFCRICVSWSCEKPRLVIRLVNMLSMDWPIRKTTDYFLPFLPINVSVPSLTFVSKSNPCIKI